MVCTRTGRPYFATPQPSELYISEPHRHAHYIHGPIDTSQKLSLNVSISCALFGERVKEKLTRRFTAYCLAQSIQSSKYYKCVCFHYLSFFGCTLDPRNVIINVINYNAIIIMVSCCTSLFAQLNGTQNILYN